jgi:hypothetical protein
MGNRKPDLTGSSRIRINGDDGYLFGVNLPFIKCGIDFGGSKWGAFGIGSNNPPSSVEPLSSQALRGAFQKLRRTGANIVRWFVFVDGRAGITYDAANHPTGLDKSFFRDTDAALKIADESGLKIMFVLTSFEWMKRNDPITDPLGVMGGRSDILKNPGMQDELIENVFVPFFKRYANNDSVVAYDVANEPEWYLTGLTMRGKIFQPNPKTGDPIPLNDFTRFVKKVAAAVNANAPGQYVTLGSARAEWLKYWTDVGLDFYQFHYYPDTEDQRTLSSVLQADMPAGLTLPIWLGEFPANLPGNPQFMYDALETAYNSGLAGAAPWALRDDKYGAANLQNLKAFSEVHSADINQGRLPRGVRSRLQLTPPLPPPPSPPAEVIFDGTRSFKVLDRSRPFAWQTTPKAASGWVRSPRLWQPPSVQVPKPTPWKPSVLSPKPWQPQPQIPVPPLIKPWQPPPAIPKPIQPPPPFGIRIGLGTQQPDVFRSFPVKPLPTQPMPSWERSRPTFSTAGSGWNPDRFGFEPEGPPQNNWVRPVPGFTYGAWEHSGE